MAAAPAPVSPAGHPGFRGRELADHSRPANPEPRKRFPALLHEYFPGTTDTAAPSEYWVMGLVTALAFFACIVLHELGHAVVARSWGMPIRGITLFLFGGVAELGDEPVSPGSEFLMAIGLAAHSHSPGRLPAGRTSAGAGGSVGHVGASSLHASPGLRVTALHRPGPLDLRDGR